ncbi:arginase family protein [Fibrobacter sp. UWH6]|uniref:arginase family protein n=1 Tax=Fibrobacter sp. (strain UWH6) TaxID=1896212 RepID=UPI000915F509|nr:arginase family protein [Fibrobacter sp. UWH6]MDO4947506.1 arginase family protein [Fibrobacter sp.]SHK51381.1 Arginase family protein [Fibrobacter sp. UWH6]
MNFCTIQDFTGIYSEQPFMQELRERANVYWMDCTNISGTDCYCDDDAQAEIRKMMDQAADRVTANNDAGFTGIHFFDNGNYHYMSKLWTDRVNEDFDLVIFDHHPDMQPPRFEGILSCGGWVKEVLDNNKFIRNVVLIGVADHLIEEIKNEPSAEFKKYASRVTFIPETLLRTPNFDISQVALAALRSSNLYISIDKDVLSIDDVVTNWDQGSLTFEQLENILKNLFAHRKILGVDICGERARNQDFPEGIDEGSADATNNALNKKIFSLLDVL